MNVKVQYANKEHVSYAQAICDLIETAAKARGTGIAKRKPEYIKSKIEKEQAVIALAGDQLAGFCYIETWQDKKYLANSGLVFNPDYRNLGLAKLIKEKIFKLSQKKFPDSKIFGITTSLAVMKINYDLGYRPVTFSELTSDEEFWKGCQSCPNYDILQRNERQNCLCTGMLMDKEVKKNNKKERNLIARRFQRLTKFKSIKKAKK